jgi:hypothetical protein
MELTAVELVFWCLSAGLLIGLLAALTQGRG